jgi:protoporphyrinogen oxidase
LGGGALGLTVALRLAKGGDSVTIIERDPMPGGLAAGFEIESGIWLERFYHHIFRSDGQAIRLIEELGLGGDLVWPRPQTVTLSGGHAYQLDSPASLLRFAPLPVVDRLRMGAALAYLRTLRTSEGLEGRTAAIWIRRYMGRRSYEVVWGPLLEGKFGSAAPEIAMPWFWARVHDRTSELGYLRGGFHRLYDALADRARGAGAETRFGNTVVALERAANGIAVATDRGVECFDRVVSTLPTRLTCALVRDVPTDYASRYAWGKALGAHCLILALNRSLTTSYWMNVNDPGYPFMALVEHTNYMSPEDYGGRHLVYLGNYRPMDDPIFGKSTAELVAEVIPHLARINSRFESSWITDQWAFKAPFAQPIVTTDYRHHIPPFETPIPNLFMANMFQIYPHDRGQNYSIALAERLVRSMDAA